MGNSQFCGQCLQTKDQAVNQKFQIQGNKKSLPKEVQHPPSHDNQNPQEISQTKNMQKKESDLLQNLPQELPLHSVIGLKYQNAIKPDIKQTTSYYPPEQQTNEPNKFNQLYNITEYGTDSALNSNIKLPQNSKASINYELSTKKIS